MNIKVISYSDIRRLPAITRHNWKWKLTKLTLVILVISIVLLFKLKLVISTMFTTRMTSPVATHRVIRHSNPCRHMTSEPEVILHEKFASRDYFFPHSYTERKCAGANKSSDADENNFNLFQTCFGDDYHCITRYQQLVIVRIPYPGNGSYLDWKFERENIGVACECSITKIV